MKNTLGRRFAKFLSLFLVFVALSCSKDEPVATPTPTPTPTPVVIKSSAKDITKFSFAALSPAIDATIDATAKTISATVPAATDVTKLVPTIAISDKATVSPATGVAQDFSKEVSYTVTAEDASTVVYKVNVKKEVVAVNTTTDFMYAGQGGSKILLKAFDATTGKDVWAFTPDANSNAQATSTPYVFDNLVFIGGADKNLYALDAKTGSKLWVYPVYINYTYMVSADGLLYCVGYDNKIYAIDAKIGIKKWSIDLPSIGSNPVLVNNVLYISASTSGTSGVVYAIDAANGEIKWKQTSNVTGSDVCVANDLVFVKNGDFGFTALEAATGVVKWKNNFQEYSPKSYLTTMNGIVYMTTFNNKSMLAFDAKTGVKKWVTNLDNISENPFASEGIVYATSGDFTIGYRCYALDAVTGETKWSSAIGLSSGFSNPIVANNLVYLPNGIIDSKTGVIKLKFPNTLTASGEFALLINGKSYYSSRSGMVQ